MTAEERTGWRDESISRKHREWGFNCPAVDLDFVMVEFNSGLPIALVEYKHHRAQSVNLNHPTYRALCALADGYRGIGMPFILAYYWPDTWAFYVYPVNQCAREVYTPSNRRLSERRFVSSLYYLRRLSLDAYVISHLKEETLPADVSLPTIVDAQGPQVQLIRDRP